MSNKITSILIMGTEPAMLYKFHGPLIRTLCAQGYDVHLAANGLVDNTFYGKKLLALGARLHQLGLSRTSVNPVKEILSCFAAWRLIRGIKPDCVLTYTIKPVIYGTLAAWLAGVKRRVALITGLGYAFTEKGNIRRRVVRWYATLLYKISLAKAHKVMFQNPDDRTEFFTNGVLPQAWQNTSNTMVVDGCGVDLSTFSQIPLPPFDQTPITFIMIARLVRDKGIIEFIEAAKLVLSSEQNARFLLLGDIDENPKSLTRSELDALTSAGLFEWKGHVDDVRPYLEQSHIFVLPSYREGLPQSTLEAMAAGRAIITTDVPGCRETVVNEINGIIIPPRDAAALAAAMTALIIDHKKIKTYAKNSRKMAEDRFDAELINTQLIAHLTAINEPDGSTLEAAIDV